MTVSSSLWVDIAFSTVKSTIAAASVTVATLVVWINAHSIFCWFLFGRLSRFITWSWSMSPSSLARRLRFLFVTFCSHSTFNIFTMMSFLTVFLFALAALILNIFRGWKSPSSSVAFLSSYYINKPLYVILNLLSESSAFKSSESSSDEDPEERLRNGLYWPSTC